MYKILPRVSLYLNDIYLKHTTNEVIGLISFEWNIRKASLWRCLRGVHIFGEFWNTNKNKSKSNVYSRISIICFGFNLWFIFSPYSYISCHQDWLAWLKKKIIFFCYSTLSFLHITVSYFKEAKIKTKNGLRSTNNGFIDKRERHVLHVETDPSPTTAREKMCVRFQEWPGNVGHIRVSHPADRHIPHTHITWKHSLGASTHT